MAFLEYGDPTVFVGLKDLPNIMPILNGKYRFYGTGDFRTWFPPGNRVSRDKIFIMKLKKKNFRADFYPEVTLFGKRNSFILNFINYKISTDQARRILKTLPPIQEVAI